MIRPADSVAFILVDYIHEAEKIDLKNASLIEIDEQAYRDWAMCAALSRVIDEPFEDGIGIIESLWLELIAKDAQYQRKDGYGVRPLKVAADQLERILAELQIPEE